MTEVPMYLLASLLIAPLAVYLMVRLGVYAALMSIYRFKQNHPDSRNPEKENCHE